MFKLILLVASSAAIALAEDPTIATEDGHLIITTQGVKQNVTDLLGKTDADMEFAKVDNRVQAVERKSVKSVSDLLTELVTSNAKMVTSNTKIAENLGNIENALQKSNVTDIKPGVVQFVTNCVPTGTCASSKSQEINAVIAGTVFENVAGIYVCTFTNPEKKTLTTPGVAKAAGPDGFAIISCGSPLHPPDHVTGKTWVSTLTVSQNGDAFKYGGKKGRDQVKFEGVAPTIVAKSQTITSDFKKDSHKFQFSLNFADADTANKDLKVTVTASSDAKFLPTSSVKISAPAADGARTFTATPNVGNKPAENGVLKLTVAVEDKWGLKGTPVVVSVNVKVSALMMKLCTYDGSTRNYDDSTWWQSTGVHNENLADTHENHRADIKTKAYNTPLGTGIKISAYVDARKVATAYYKVKANYQGKSLRELMSSGTYNNNAIAIKDRVKSTKVDTMRNNHLKKSRANDRDMFIDTNYDLKVRSTSMCGANDNRARLTVAYTGACSGHTFGGMGGTHYHSSWQVDFEAAPVTQYCAPSNRYGKNTFHRHRSYNVFTNCGNSFKTLNIEYAIEQY